jgi:hypothetical protein
LCHRRLRGGTIWPIYAALLLAVFLALPIARGIFFCCACLFAVMLVILLAFLGLMIVLVQAIGKVSPGRRYWRQWNSRRGNQWNSRRPEPEWESGPVRCPVSFVRHTMKGAIYKEVDVPSGIIDYLTRRGGTKVWESGIVRITSSKPRKAHEDYAAKNVADVRNVYSSFWSAGHLSTASIAHAPNNWICYDFVKMTIEPTAYAIRSAWMEGRTTGSNLKNWIVETSMDGQEWTAVDRQNENDQLDGSMKTATFSISRAEKCRFIRLTNIGRTWRGDDYLHLSAWEIFGTVYT